MDHGQRFSKPVPVESSGYMALEIEPDFLALAKAPGSNPPSALQLYHLTPDGMQSLQGFTWQTASARLTDHVLLLTVGGHALLSLPVNAVAGSTPDDEPSGSAGGGAQLRERNLAVVKLPQSGGAVPAPLWEYRFSSPAYARGTGVLRGPYYYFLLRDPAGTDGLTLQRVAPDSAPETVQRIAAVDAVGTAWHGERLTLALLDKAGAIWRLAGDEPRFTHETSLDKLGGAMQARRRRGGFVLAGSFALFEAGEGVVALDHAGQELVIERRDAATQMPDGGTTAFHRRLNIIRTAKELGIDPRTAGGGHYQLVEEHAIAAEARMAPTGVCADAALVLLDHDTAAVVDWLYQRVLLVSHTQQGRRR